MNINTKVKGIINLKIIRNGICHTDVTFENLILDTFFSRFANDDVLFATSQCRIGTGTTPPTNSDSSLVSQISSINSVWVGVPTSIDGANNRLVFATTSQFQFPIGSVVANIAEVGFVFAQGSSGAAMNLLNSRTLTKNEFGVPTAYTVTADDQLIINYRFEVWIPLVDYTSTLNVSGIDYDVIGRVANYSSGGPWVNTVLLLPNITSSWFQSYGATSVFGGHGVDPTANSGSSSSTQVKFLNLSGGKEIEMTASINQLNATGGIKCIAIPSGSASGTMFKYQFTPVIPKTNSKIFKIRFRMTCARA